MLAQGLTLCVWMLMSKWMVSNYDTMGYTAIMTDTDRERISGESDEPASKRYESTSRIRNRIEELQTDAEVLKEHHPQLYNELRAVVCEEE